MHSRIFTSAMVATFSVAVVFLPKIASAIEWYDGQEILVECPSWQWESSGLSGITYELCFDDIDHCTAADIGDSVCVPSLGEHDVWVTAIDDQGGDPVYYDGEVVSIHRVRGADFSGNGMVDFSDLFLLLDQLGAVGEIGGDLDGNGVVDFEDLWIFLESLGKCVSDTGQLYEAC